MSKTSTTKKNDYEVGSTVAVPFHLSAGTLYVSCVITDERNVFGRRDVEVSPLEGSGVAWVQISRIEDGTGPTAHRSKGWQDTHNRPATPEEDTDE